MRKGFTLVELLISIAIVAIVAAFLIPMLSKPAVKSKTKSQPVLSVKWQRIQDEYGKPRMSRTKVPLGWLVGNNFDSAVVYVPDPEHLWKLPVQVEND